MENHEVEEFKETQDLVISRVKTLIHDAEQHLQVYHDEPETRKPKKEMEQWRPRIRLQLVDERLPASS